MQDEVKEHLKKMKRSGSKTSDSGSKNSDQEYFRKSDHDEHGRDQSLEGKTSETFHQENDPPPDHEECDGRKIHAEAIWCKYEKNYLPLSIEDILNVKSSVNSYLDVFRWTSSEKCQVNTIVQGTFSFI